METLHLFLLQIQCIAILFTLWKMRQWLLELERKTKFLDDVQKSQVTINNTILEYIKDLRSIGDNQTLLNSDTYKQLVEQNKRIYGLNERLKNTEECYKILKSRFNNSEIVYTGGCDAANGNTTIIKTIKENGNKTD